METDDKAGSSPAGKSAETVKWNPLLNCSSIFFSLSKWRKHFFFFFFVLIQKDEPKDQNAKMIKILSGEMAIELHLQFLIRNNNTDLMILKNTKVK